MGSLLDRAKARKSKSSSTKTPRKKSLTAEQQAVVDSAKMRTDQLLSDARGFTEAQKYIEEMKQNAPVDYARLERDARSDMRADKNEALLGASEAYEAGPIRDFKTNLAAKGAGSSAGALAKKSGFPRTTQNMVAKKARESAQALADKRPQSTSGLSADNLRKLVHGSVPLLAAPLAYPPLAQGLLSKISPTMRAARNAPFMSEGSFDQAKKQAMGGMSEEQKKFKLMLDAVKKAQEK